MKVYTLNADALKELMSLIQGTIARDYDSPKYSESSPMLEETYDDADDYVDDYDDVDDYDAYDKYMEDAKRYLDKAYEYLGVKNKNIPETEHNQPRYYNTDIYKPERRPEYKPERKPVSKPKASACSCGDACKCKSEKTFSLPKITRVIFNDPDTTVFFDDGTISHVKTVAGDKFDKEHGILYAIFKRLYGRHGEREGMYGLMPGAGASLLLQQIVKNADDLKEVKTASKKVKSEPAPDYQPQPIPTANRRWYSRTIKK